MIDAVRTDPLCFSYCNLQNAVGFLDDSCDPEAIGFFPSNCVEHPPNKNPERHFSSRWGSWTYLWIPWEIWFRGLWSVLLQQNWVAHSNNCKPFPSNRSCIPYFMVTTIITCLQNIECPVWEGFGSRLGRVQVLL